MGTGLGSSCLAAFGVVAAAFAVTRRLGVQRVIGSAPKRSNQTTVVARAFENELGVQPPVGFWDPLGFTADGNAEDFARRRQTEIKHGRVSMLACMADITNGLGAISKVPLAGWGQILAYGAFCELSQD